MPNFWKKHQTQLFLKTGMTTGESPAPIYARLGLSTVLDIALNAETEDFDFIKDESPTTEIDRFAPSLSQEIMCQEGDSCFEYIWGLFYDLPTGVQAESELLVAFPKTESTSSSTTAFKGWKMPCTIIVSDFDAVAKKITFDIKSAGDVVQGSITVTDGAPTFVAA